MSGKGYTYKSHGTNSQVSIRRVDVTLTADERLVVADHPTTGQPLLRPRLRQQRHQLQLVPLLQHVCPASPRVQTNPSVKPAILTEWPSQRRVLLLLQPQRQHLPQQRRWRRDLHGAERRQVPVRLRRELRVGQLGRLGQRRQQVEQGGLCGAEQCGAVVWRWREAFVWRRRESLVEHVGQLGQRR